MVQLLGGTSRIGLALGGDLGQRVQLSPTEVRRLRARLRREPAFQIYTASGSLGGVSRFMFTDMLQCSPDAHPDLLQFKFDRLLSRAELAHDSQLIAFLRQCYDRFRGLFDGEETVLDDQET